MSGYQTVLYKILEAQKANIERIATLGAGALVGSKTLVDPLPDFVRVSDRPLHQTHSSRWASKACFVTLGPIRDAANPLRVARKDARLVTYGVFVQCRLTDDEVKEDQASEDGFGLLSTKQDGILWNLKAVMHDDFNLVTEECGSGLQDDMQINVDFQPDAQYPVAAFMLVVTASTYERS